MYWKKLLNWSKDTVQHKYIEIEGSKIILRSKKVEDAKLDYEWRKDPELSALDATVPINITFNQFLSHTEEDIKYPVPWSVKYAVETNSSKLIGYVMYYDIDLIEKQAEVGIIIGDKEFLGKGYGTDALKTLVNHIFETTGLIKLYLHTLTTNKRAQKSFNRTGFIDCGPVRKDGMNFIKMEILKKDWEANTY
jgi:RimJ/RimL family protein N-acetyltransferase